MVGGFAIFEGTVITFTIVYIIYTEVILSGFKRSLPPHILNSYRGDVSICKFFHRCKHHLSSEIIPDQDFTEEIFLNSTQRSGSLWGCKKTARDSHFQKNMSHFEKREALQQDCYLFFQWPCVMLVTSWKVKFRPKASLWGLHVYMFTCFWTFVILKKTCTVNQR